MKNSKMNRRTFCATSALSIVGVASGIANTTQARLPFDDLLTLCKRVDGIEENAKWNGGPDDKIQLTTLVGADDGAPVDDEAVRFRLRELVGMAAIFGAVECEPPQDIFQLMYPPRVNISGGTRLISRFKTESSDDGEGWITTRNPEYDTAKFEVWIKRISWPVIKYTEKRYLRLSQHTARRRVMLMAYWAGPIYSGLVRRNPA